MSRRDVIEVKCDRCERTEVQTSQEMPKGPGPEFEGIFQGKKVKFSDLCRVCRKAVAGYYTRIAKEGDDQVKPEPIPLTNPVKK